MLVIICIKYGKNPSRTADATERTRFSRPRPNDLEDIGQGQRSLYATHPLILVMIFAKYGKNPSRTVIFFFNVKAEKFPKFAKNSNFQILKKTWNATHPLMIAIICAKYKKNPSRTVDATERTRFSKSRPNDLGRYRWRSKVIVCDTPSHGSDHLWLIWKESIQNCRCYRADMAGGTDGRTDGRTDRQTDGVKPIYPPTTSLFGGHKYKNRDRYFLSTES